MFRALWLVVAHELTKHKADVRERLNVFKDEQILQSGHSNRDTWTKIVQS